MKILVFDNYDSFTYNLVHLVVKILKQPVDVFRNDEITLDKVNQYDKIILSPGPGVPEEAGILLPLVKEYAASKSILGVCLGHQGIAEAFGGILVNLETVFHGVATKVTVEPGYAGKGLFREMPGSFETGRYHSWIVSEGGFPAELEITARDENGYIMALQHRNWDIRGVQFHPESILTPLGEKLMENWLNS